LQLKKLHVVKLGRGYAWLDTGTHDALLEAAEFVRTIQHRQGLLVGCPEEVAYMKRFITGDELRGLAANYGKTAYGRYLLQLVDETDTQKAQRDQACEADHPSVVASSFETNRA
jgi:glucose-1-phosphate thymidylyltransferase